MKTILLLIPFLYLPVLAVDKINPDKPKLFQGADKVAEKKLETLQTITIPPAPGLYRSWKNPEKEVSRPSENRQSRPVVTPAVRKPGNEQTFFKSKEWKPAKVVYLYEKSKDFDTLLNPLSLRDFNRFIYQRNPSSP